MSAVKFSLFGVFQSLQVHWRFKVRSFACYNKLLIAKAHLMLRLGLVVSGINHAVAGAVLGFAIAER